METKKIIPTHYPVMWKEIVDTVEKHFSKDIETHFLDGTGGEGGHVLKIKNAFPHSKILFLDRDPIMIQRALSRLDGYSNINSLCKNFSELEKNDLDTIGWKQGCDSILLDLGISTFHITESGRGFSFRGNESLDMRMNPDISHHQITAAEILNTYSQRDLERIFYEYGEERWTKKIVERLIEKRKSSQMETNSDFAKLVESAIPRKFWPPKSHPSVRVFQALRIEVNQELKHLEIALKQLPFLLKPNGIFQVISFHSLEDRLVKHAFRNLIQTNNGFQFIYKKPLLPSEDEIINNPPSRSAKLRAICRSTDTIGKRKY
jgi:16S rRNA (cytosine1402-N4)-methyltransferase